MVTTLSEHEAARVSAFYAHLLARLGGNVEAQSVVVAHVLPDAPLFLNALNSIAPISLLLAKPKSLESKSGRRVADSLTYPRHSLSREWAEDVDAVLRDLRSTLRAEVPFVLCDIGAYFAPSLEAVGQSFGDQFLGVLEGTENGAAVYERHYKELGRAPSAPILSVARSSLKLPEDFLVGAGIVFSIEAILREHGQVLQTRTAAVIGFGRVGRAVAEALRVRGVPTVIYDVDPIACAEASVRGYPVYARLEDAVAFGTLVVSATGTHALGRTAIESLRRGAVVASVTSRDSEFDEPYLLDAFDEALPEDVSAGMSLYREVGGDREFWLINNGNAPNFVHGAVLGPALHLISGEKLAAVHSLVSRDNLPLGTATSPLTEIDKGLRRKVAETWNTHFIEIR
jgi:adenosylhomocysteinase